MWISNLGESCLPGAIVGCPAVHTLVCQRPRGASFSECLLTELRQLWEVRLEEPASILRRRAEAPLEEEVGETLRARLAHGEKLLVTTQGNKKPCPIEASRSLEAKISLLSLSQPCPA